MAGAIRRERDIGLWLVGVDLCLGATSFLVVSWRRRWPVAVASGLGLTAIVSISSSGPGLLAAASLATRRRVREIGPVAAVTIVCWGLFELITANPAPLWQVLASTIVVIAGAVGLGGYVGFRRERAAHG